MLKILIVSQSYYPVLGGVSEHVGHLAGELGRRGHRVTVLTGGVPRGNGECFAAGLGDGDGPFEVLRIGRTFRVPCNGGRAAVVCEPGLGSALTRIDPRGFDVVHVHSPLEPLLPLAAVRYFRTPIVATFHSAGRTDRGYRVFRRWLRPILDRIDVRLAVSPVAADFVRRTFPGEYRILPNGVDLDRFSAPPRRAGPPGRSLRILAAGRLDPRKGLEVLLEAARLLRERAGPVWELQIVGEGSGRRQLEKTVRAQRLPVRFLGAVSPEEIPLRYREADIAVAPATYGESFGVVLLEAMAAALPVVASDLPGYRGVLAPSGGGLLVPPGDPHRLADALHQLGLDPARRLALGESGRDYVRRFSWKRLTSRLEAIYEQAIARRASDRPGTISRGTSVAPSEPARVEEPRASSGRSGPAAVG